MCKFSSLFLVETTQIANYKERKRSHDSLQEGGGISCRRLRHSYPFGDSNIHVHIVVYIFIQISTSIYLYVYIYIYICVCVCICI
ncbi:uncharacterized protein C5L36_0A09275 [Pichia kudriavzevii]|uniref:Uncharacterized protein n=1 Tax=Pichia kudriavzevii TaxID=4909 RepID=A0A2U9QZA0_PICKU|nr:uncharacterized protein C5L36_0A09275 [Pichia kudriavzevii]AWU74335.1 hypothetical protein C5L36_0A09275 [Pichia kudriavzevii]